MSDQPHVGLRSLAGATCARVAAIEIEDVPTVDIYRVMTEVHFADGTKLSAQFWRLIKGDAPLVSIFDHRHKYGLAAPIDAFQILRDELVGRPLEHAAIDGTTGDLVLTFVGGLLLQIFNFTAYEIWDVRFPDGTLLLSNYVFAK